MADLIAIVSDAERTSDPKPELRACGSHWALSDAAVPDTSPGKPDGYFIETNDPDGQGPRLNQPLYDVVPGCLSDEARRFFISQAGLPGSLSSRHGA